MKAIIVDDEQLLLNEFRRMLDQYSQLDIVGAYTDPTEVLLEAGKTKPDIAFLDIEMPGLNGIELAERLQDMLPELEIFFITAYNHYATEAFEANALDYILKPVRPERLQKALERLNKKRGERKPKENEPLRIQCFGKFGIYIGEEAVKWTRKKPRELFAYMLQSEGQWVDKFKICDDLWRDSYPEQALANLQTAVWAIRRVLKEAGVLGAKIEFANDSYILTLKDALWDLPQFVGAYKAYMNTGELIYAQKAMKLYRDGYLFYEDWPWSVFDREKYAIWEDYLEKYLP